jgi:predicted enzyme related to lactoylglutathione lyase
MNGLNAVEVVTVFVEDLARVKEFYLTVFDTEIIYEDQHSAVLKFDNLMINLLQVDQAATLIEPAAVGDAHAGARALFTIAVADADATCAELQRRGVQLLNGPVDRPWGRRTAAFADPAGTMWEIAQELPDRR